MKRVTVARVTVGEREVNCNAKLDLTATKDVLKERVALVELKILKADTLILGTTDKRILKLTFAQLCDVAGKVSKIDMLAALLRFEKLKANLTLRVFVSHLAG